MGSEISGVITSDVLPLTGVDVVVDAGHLPFGKESLRAIAMTNVFHHLPDSRSFLREFARCAKSRGALIMIEPWVTKWSKRVYGSLHHEPFDIAALAVFLAGPGARNITGQSFNVDGGIIFD